MTALAASAVAVGDTIAPLSRRVGQEQINAYADASGDHNPIHLDAGFAVSVGLPGTNNRALAPSNAQEEHAILARVQKSAVRS